MFLEASGPPGLRSGLEKESVLQGKNNKMMRHLSKAGFRL